MWYKILNHAKNLDISETKITERLIYRQFSLIRHPSVSLGKSEKLWIAKTQIHVLEVSLPPNVGLMLRVTN